MRRSLRAGSMALAGVALPALLAGGVRAQNPAPRDTLTLGALQAAAVRSDPRARQMDLLASQSALREKSLDAERLPVLGMTAQGQ